MNPISVSISCVPNPDGALVDALARAGLDAVEISLPGREYAGFGHAEFARRAHDAGLDVRSFHLPFYTDETVDPASLDADVRRRTTEIQSHYLRVAASMGARLAVVHPGLEPVADCERAERLARAKESLVALADVAEDLGMALCVENLPRSCLGNSVAEMADIVGCDPRLRVCFDVNHLLKDTHEAFLKALGPLVVATHISDYDFGDERHWFPGEGLIDWPALVAGLDAAGYSGAYNYELSFHDDPAKVDRPRDLTPEDVVRNAHELFAKRRPATLGSGGRRGLPAWGA